MAKVCPICKYSINHIVFKEFNIDILRCVRCGHIFSSYDIDQHYDKYFDQTNLLCSPGSNWWWNEAHKAIYNDFCHKFIVGKSGKLLDVGCGLGYFVKMVYDYDSWEVFGYEISQEAVDFAVKMGLKNVFCGRVETSSFMEKQFDIITLWDVIEHIPEPDPILSYLSSLLKDDGILFIYTPNARIQLLKAKIKKLLRGMKPGVHYMEAKDHINNYQMSTLTIILKRNRFSNVEFIQIRPIQGVSGSRNQFLVAMKNLWFYIFALLFRITFGHINLNNLAVIARK